MSTTYKFTTDRHFRLVDTDPELSALLSVKTLIGEALDEYVTREDLPHFLQCIVDVFKGTEIKREPVHFLIGEAKYKTLINLKPISDKHGLLTAIKGSVVLLDEPLLIKNVKKTKDA
ncbi:MAG: hypothetical protein KC585_04065 [Candidatus Magasanikbacteria bacterium]|nr:hypothetical protein [Candidatus Magasanikbacteria bacterium]